MTDRPASVIFDTIVSSRIGSPTRYSVVGVASLTEMLGAASPAGLVSATRQAARDQPLIPRRPMVLPPLRSPGSEGRDRGPRGLAGVIAGGVEVLLACLSVTLRRS